MPAVEAIYCGDEETVVVAGEIAGQQLCEIYHSSSYSYNGTEGTFSAHFGEKEWLGSVDMSVPKKTPSTDGSGPLFGFLYPPANSVLSGDQFHTGEDSLFDKSSDFRLLIRDPYLNDDAEPTSGWLSVCVHDALP